VDISCAFAPVLDTPDHIALAERLGYRRAWVYDTPALQLDVLTPTRDDLQPYTADQPMRSGFATPLKMPSLSSSANERECNHAS
jgi:5,10-methylenetetrahydromethanopterin reductase